MTAEKKRRGSDLLTAAKPPESKCVRSKPHSLTPGGGESDSAAATLTRKAPAVSDRRGFVFHSFSPETFVGLTMMSYKIKRKQKRKGSV